MGGTNPRPRWKRETVMKDAIRRSFLTVGVACAAVLTASCDALQEGLAGLRAMDETRPVGAVGVELSADSAQLRIHVISCDLEVDRLLIETPEPLKQTAPLEMKEQEIVLPRAQAGYFTVDVGASGVGDSMGKDGENSVVGALFKDPDREFSVSPIRREEGQNDLRFVQGLSMITLNFLKAYELGTVLMHGNFDGKHDTTAYTPVPASRIGTDIEGAWSRACLS